MRGSVDVRNRVSVRGSVGVVDSDFEAVLVRISIKEVHTVYLYMFHRF